MTLRIGKCYQCGEFRELRLIDSLCRFCGDKKKPQVEQEKARAGREALKPLDKVVKKRKKLEGFMESPCGKK